MSSVPGNSRALSGEEELTLSYALSKQVPSMRTGCTISTSYGDIHFDGVDAVELSLLVGQLLAAKLKALREEF